MVFRWRIRNGRHVSFWFDWWHDKGPLYLLFSNMDIYQSRIPRTTTVRCFYDTVWQPSATLHSFLSWQDPPPTFQEDIDDELVWAPLPSSSFSVSIAWNHVRRKGHSVQWHSFVWDRHLIPRHSFLLWVISLNRLPTQTFLLHSSRIEPALCAFCGEVPDSINHLFFECASTRGLASFWATKCYLPWRNRPWQEHITWAMKVCGGPSFAHSLSRFSFGALCHIIWTERNNAIFRNKDIFIPGMRKHIIKVVRDKAITFGTVTDTPLNRRLQRNWGLPPSIFLSR